LVGFDRRARGARGAAQVAMACMILGIIFFGILLGSIAEALQHMSKESERVARYRARMEVVDKWMAKRRLPLKLRSRIGHYYAEARRPPRVACAGGGAGARAAPGA
jgi:hypothetical protein